MGVFPSESLDTQCLVFASQYPEHHERCQEWSENTGARGGGSLHCRADEEDTVLSGIWDTGPGSSLLKMHPAVTGETPGRRAALAGAAPRWLTRPVSTAAEERTQATYAAGWTTSAKGKAVNILGFAGNIRSSSHILFCFYNPLKM